MPVEAIIILGGGTLAVAVTLFYVIRFVMYVFHPEYRSAPAMSAEQWFNAVLVVSGLLVLFWYVIAGNKMAVFVYVTIMVVGKIYAHRILGKSRGGGGNNGT